MTKEKHRKGVNFVVNSNEFSAEDISIIKQRRASIYSSFLNLNISNEDEEVLDDQQYDIISSQTEMITNLVVWNEYDPNNSKSKTAVFY